MKKNMKTKNIKRGDIYYANLNPVAGSEQGDTRPVLVVQNDLGNKYSPTIIIIPLTCKLSKTQLPTHVFIPQGYGPATDSIALSEQIRTIDRSRLSGYIGCIDSELQSEIDTALAIGIGLENRCSPKGEMFVLTLCSRCEADFNESGYVVVKKGYQEVREDCDFCKGRKGLVFGVFKSGLLL